LISHTRDGFAEILIRQEATILRLIEEDVPNAMEDAASLCSAALKGSLAILTRLLEDARGDLNRKDEHGWTPLLIARQYGQTEAAELLSRRGGETGEMPNKWVALTPWLEVSEEGDTVKSTFAGKSVSPLRPNTLFDIA
jgi:ankyrin repeat protein